MAWSRPVWRQAVYQDWGRSRVITRLEISLWSGEVESEYNEGILYIWLPATSMNVVEQNVSGRPHSDDRLDGFH